MRTDVGRKRIVTLVVQQQEVHVVAVICENVGISQKCCFRAAAPQIVDDKQDPQACLSLSLERSSDARAGARLDAEFCACTEVIGIVSRTRGVPRYQIAAARLLSADN